MQSDVTTIGLLHPGQMGAAVGATAKAGGSRVVWVGEGRSDATHARADADELEDVAWLNALVNQSDVVLSICPPDAAVAVAEEVAALGFRKIYVDANAVSPATARRVAEIVERSGASYVDGGIIGGPPRRAGTTRLYLSGERARRVATLLGDGPLETIAIEGPATAASALKMAYAGYTKGSTALLIAMHALALHEGVHEALMAEWERSQPELIRRSGDGISSAAAKAWRFVGEMEEIAASLQAAGVPDGFHRAAAELYGRLERFRDDPDAPGGAELARYVIEGGDE